MKTCLIYPEQIGLKEPEAYAPLGLLYIASSLENHGYDVSIESMASNDINIPFADYYGIQILTANYDQSKKLVNRIRDQYPKSKIIIGGPHCSALAIETYDDIHPDYLVDGEGERVILSIVRGDVEQGIVYANRIYDLDNLSFPSRHLMKYNHVFNKTGIHLKGSDIATTIVTSRGCPYYCAFCSKIRINSGVRYRSPNNIIDELNYVKERWNCNRFRIVDDAFTIDRPRIEELCELLYNKDFKFFCILRADTIQDIYILGKMKLAGIEEVSLGLESADPEVLKLMNKRETIEEISLAINLCKEQGIRVKVFIIEGLPGETEKSIELLKDFMTRNKPDSYTLSKFQILPDSMIYKNPEKYGLKDVKLGGWFYPDINKSELRLWLESGVWR